MKRLIISMMVAMFLMTGYMYAEASPKEKPHFRQSYWGDSIQEAKATLTDEDEIMAEDNEIILVVHPDTSDYVTLYTFADNKLTSGGYIYSESHSYDNMYIDEFEKMKSILIEKYGSPQTDKWIWVNDLYQDEPSRHGFAISLGHLNGHVVWEIPQSFYDGIEDEDSSQDIVTRLILDIRGDNYKIKVCIAYFSREFQYLVEEKTAKKNNKNF